VRVGGAAGRVVGRITSAGHGYTVGASIAYAYLPVEHARPGTRLSVDLFGEWVDGVVAADTLYDPSNSRIRA
jgi:glycine cleavage system aminomethyltransferase T